MSDDERVRIRPARPDEAQLLDALMKAAARDLFPRFYDARQTQAGVRYIAVVDPQLIDDGTYLVVEAGGEPVACGGWSRRDKLFAGAEEGAEDARLLDPATEPARVRAMFVRADWTRRGLGSMILEESERAARDEGFRRASLMATLAGVPLYTRHGYAGSGQVDIHLPDGTNVPGVPMTKDLC